MLNYTTTQQSGHCHTEYEMDLLSLGRGEDRIEVLKPLSEILNYDIMHALRTCLASCEQRAISLRFMLMVSTDSLNAFKFILFESEITLCVILFLIIELVSRMSGNFSLLLASI